MKKTILFLLACQICLTGVSVQAEETVASLKEKRIELLGLMVTQLEQDYSEGLCGIDEVIEAEIRLVKLKRRCSIEFQDKQTFLKKLLELEKRRLKILSVQYRSGGSEVGATDVQRCQLRVMARQQKLLEANAK